LTYNQGTASTQLEWTCPSDGTYLVWASDYLNATGTGSYRLQFDRFNNPENPARLLPCQTETGTIERPWQMRAYSFAAVAGDKCLLRMAVVSGDLHTRVAIHRSDGTRLIYTQGSAYAQLEWNCPSDGTYLVWVSADLNATGTGTYYLSLEGPRCFAVTTSSSPATGGTTRGGGSYNSGTSVTVTAIANPGYRFERWTENSQTVSTNNPYTFTITGDRALVAVFSRIAYSVTTSSSPPKEARPAPPTAGPASR
jgi:hypothetical protein